MINWELTIWIKDKLTSNNLLIFVGVMAAIGFVLNIFEPYPFFIILCPLLLLMFSSTTKILKDSLKKLSGFTNEKNVLNDYCKKYFPSKTNPIIYVFTIIIIVAYFVCLYKLEFLYIDLMGIYILFLGGGTFLVALIGYEMYLRFTFLLSAISADTNFLNKNYDLKNPKQTDWLCSLHHLSKNLKTASLIIGLLFVFENFMFYVSNYFKKNDFIEIDNILSLKKIADLSFEFWVIWITISLGIGVVFPLLAFWQSRSFKKIILVIHNSYDKQIFQQCNTLFSIFYTLLLSQYAEKSLKETFFTQRIDKLIYWGTSILTHLIQILSLCDMY